jgi:hypothetical protein
VTLPELKKLLDLLEIPVIYHHWPVGDAPSLPYLVYYADEDIGFLADDTVYSEGYAVTIEVYSKMKDLALEAKVKRLLNDNKIPYRTYEDFLDSEDMYLKAYEIKI